MKKITAGWLSTGLSAAAFFFSLTSVPAIAGTNDYYNVKAYGATNNGTSDDSYAIQRAINAAATSVTRSRVVYFPAGTYLINTNLVLANYVSLLGEGLRDDAGGTARIKAGATLSSMICTPTNYLTTNGAQQGTSITVENLTLDGDGHAVTWAMDLCDLMNGRIADVSITNLTGGGINSWWDARLQSSWENWFVNLNIEVSGYALRVHSSDCWVNGVVVTGGKGLLEDGYCDVLYKNCVVSNCENGLSFAPTCLGVFQQTSIADCQFIGNTNYGVECAFTSQYYKSYVSIDGCSFADNGKADVCLSNCTMTTLHNNDFMTTSPSCRSNIYMVGSVASNTLTGNRFACATQTVAGANSFSVSNQFSVSSWGNPNVIPFEIGSITNVTNSMSVSFLNYYAATPIVIAQTVTASDTNACVTYVSNITNSNFQLVLTNWDSNGVHSTAETINYLAMKKGHYLLNQMDPDRYNPGAVCDRFARSHTQMEAEAGYIGGVTSGWKNVVFTKAFSQTPVVFVQWVRVLGSVVATVRIKDCSTTGFSVMVQGNVAVHGNHPVAEGVNYIAITPGWSDEGDLRVLSGQSVSSNAPAPLMFGDSYMAPQFVAGMQSCNDTNPCVWRWDPNSLEKGGVRVAIEGSNTTTHGAETFGWLVSGIPDVVAPGTGTVLGCILNVKKDYGAQGWLGTNAPHDDTTNIQAALNAAMPGDTVYFPMGIYNISSSLFLNKSDITILGEGDDIACQTRIVPMTDMTTMVSVSGSVSRVRIAKLAFENYTNNSHTVDHVLFLPNMTDSTIDRVRIDYMTSNAITIKTNSSRIRIRNSFPRTNENCGIVLSGNDCIIESSYVDSNGRGIEITGSGNRIINTHVDGSRLGGIYFPYSQTCSNTTMRNCYFDLNANGISFYYGDTHSANAGIESCCFRLNGTADFYCQYVTNVLISGCSFTDWVVPPPTNSFVTLGSIDYFTVIGNVFWTPTTIPGTNLHSTAYGNVIP